MEDTQNESKITGVSRSTAEQNQVLPDWLKYDSDSSYKEDVNRRMRTEEVNKLNNDLGPNAPDWLKYSTEEDAVKLAVEARIAAYKAQAANVRRLVDKVKQMPSEDIKQ